MTRNKMAIASLVLVILMLVLSFPVASQLPAGAQLPTHWNLAGEADGRMVRESFYPQG